MNNEIKKFLLHNGCCWRCILIFLGESIISKFEVASQIGLYSNCNVQDCINNTDFSRKRLKEGICISCLGILHLCDSSDTINKIKSAFTEEEYDAPKFSLSLSLPASLGLRIYSIWAQLLNKFPAMLFEIPDARTKHLGTLKDVWKNIVGPRLGTIISKSFVSGQVVDFSITVHAEYADDEKECQLLEKLNPQKFELRRKQHKKYNEGLFTRQVVEDTLKSFNDEEFLNSISELPTEPKIPAFYNKVECNHISLYLAGRYAKYSRELPQTPWLVEGDRRFESSVQEYICDPLNQFIKPLTVKFSASGREDVDVRCLGRGRPFVIECMNPHRTIFTSKEVTDLQDAVNASTDLVFVRDLQIVSKKDLSNLKDGEEEKTKSYCALCFSKENITQEHIKTIEATCELIIHQMTPIRVLHRRTLSSRDRIIHSMKVEPVNDNFFKLYLTTQAGTYIKEFIHSDFGRTKPNLGSLIGIEVDIIALDVEDVQLDWPPSLEE